MFLFFYFAMLKYFAYSWNVLASPLSCFTSTVLETRKQPVFTLVENYKFCTCSIIFSQLIIRHKIQQTFELPEIFIGKKHFNFISHSETVCKALIFLFIYLFFYLFFAWVERIVSSFGVCQPQLCVRAGSDRMGPEGRGSCWDTEEPSPYKLTNSANTADKNLNSLDFSKMLTKYICLSFALWHCLTFDLTSKHLHLQLFDTFSGSCLIIPGYKQEVKDRMQECSIQASTK